MSSQYQKNTLFLHAFNLLPQFGPSRLIRLSKHFNNNFEQAFFSERSELLKSGLENEIIETWLSARNQINLNKEEENLHASNINILTYLDKNYPKLLLEISKFPPLLYYRGKMNQPEEICLAVVGTRKITSYGLSIMNDLLAPLVEAKITITSGMAFGVDSEAHKISIKKNKRTIAILGGGLDDSSIYPKHHQYLAKQILDSGGAMISEYPPGTPNFKQHFVARNRIISGLSIATLVIECGLDSGSLITAQHALEQNRQVYAVPGPIFSEMAKGPNNLLKMGAKAVTEAKDIFDDLNLENLPEEIESQIALEENPKENTLLMLLGKEPKTIDELIKESRLEASEVTSALTFLEMKGRIRNLGGQQYIKNR